MNLPFEIVHYEDGDYGTIYTFKVADRSEPELDRFLSDSTITDAPDFSRLAMRLSDLVHRKGLYHRTADFGEFRWFRDEGDGVDALWAPIPEEEKKRYKEPYPTLRLYCFRITGIAFEDHRGTVHTNTGIIVVGNGGIKTRLRPEDDDTLNRALKEAKVVRRRQYERLESGLVRTADGGYLLDGDLSFE